MNDKIATCISAIVTICLILIVIYVVLFGVGMFTNLFGNMYHDEVIAENTSIFSLHDTNLISGSFLLGCGQIHGEMRYTLYIEVDNDGIKMEQIPVDKTIIYEDAESTPYLAEYNLWKVTSSGEVLSKYHSKRGYPYYELHVPPGTVIQEYSLGGK